MSLQSVMGQRWTSGLGWALGCCGWLAVGWARVASAGLSVALLHTVSHLPEASWACSQGNDTVLRWSKSTQGFLALSWKLAHYHFSHILLTTVSLNDSDSRDGGIASTS